MLRFVLIVPAIAGVVEAHQLRARNPAPNRSGAGSAGTSDGHTNGTAGSASNTSRALLSARGGRVAPHYKEWWTGNLYDKSGSKLVGGIQAMGRMIQGVEYPVEKLGDDEIKAIESVGPFQNASQLFEEASWAESSSVFFKPVIFCIKDLLEKKGVSHYSDQLQPSKDAKRFCDFLGEAEIAPAVKLAGYVDDLFSTVKFSYTDSFGFACADCAQSWVSYNPTRPPRAYNPTMPPIDYDPTRPPIPGYNPTMPPSGYNPTMPPAGYNPTMPPAGGVPGDR